MESAIIADVSLEFVLTCLVSLPSRLRTILCCSHCRCQRCDMLAGLLADWLDGPARAVRRLLFSPPLVRATEPIRAGRDPQPAIGKLRLLVVRLGPARGTQHLEPFLPRSLRP